jgi:hypothetical protein
VFITVTARTQHHKLGNIKQHNLDLPHSLKTGSSKPRCSLERLGEDPSRVSQLLVFWKSSAFLSW